MTKAISGFSMILALVLAAPAMAKESDELKDQLLTGIELSKVGLSGNVSKIGTKFVLRLENIQGQPSVNAATGLNSVDAETGQRTEDSMGRRMLTGALNFNKNKRTAGLIIEPGSLVGIRKLAVEGKNIVEVQVVSLKQGTTSTFGNAEAQYLIANLRFHFKKDLDETDPADIKKVVFGKWLEPLGQPNPVQTTSAAPQTVGDAARVTPATSSGSDLTGKSVDELVTLFGKDFTTVSVGPRTIYIWKDLGVRVPVENGKAVKP